MSHLYQFAVFVQHDDGIMKVLTVATTELAAKNNVIQAENCPESSIKKEVETIKQYY